VVHVETNHEAVVLDAAITSPAPVRSAVGRLDAIIWSMIATTAALVVVSMLAGSFRPALLSFAAPVAVCVLLAALAWFYRTWRPDAGVEGALTGTLQLVAFAGVAAPLSYVGMALSAPFPLQDWLFDAADKALGLDWLSLLAWTDNHPTLHTVLRMAYGTITLQSSVAIFVLAFTGRAVWLRVFLLSFMAATLLAIAVAVILPAYGVWGYYGLGPHDYPHIDPVVRDLPVPIINALRDGSLRTLVAIGAEGIITFPSLHTAFAIILVVAFWPVPLIRWVGLALNVLMLASTPVDGAHYFTDMFAGAAVACVAVGWALSLVRRFDGQASFRSDIGTTKALSAE
jgi:membrane-associated phospholipid phosphatase